MTKIVDLKIRLDLLRIELDDELSNGSSITRVKKLHANIKVIEKLLLLWETLPEPKN